MELFVELQCELDEDISCNFEVFGSTNIDRELEFKELVIGGSISTILTRFEFLLRIVRHFLWFESLFGLSVRLSELLRCAPFLQLFKFILYCNINSN